jgi:hypothetical protein
LVTLGLRKVLQTFIIIVAVDPYRSWSALLGVLVLLVRVLGVLHLFGQGVAKDHEQPRGDDFSAMSRDGNEVGRRDYQLAYIDGPEAFELIIELPGQMWDGVPEASLNRLLNEAANETLRYWWLMIHTGDGDPLPFDFVVTPWSDRNTDFPGPCSGPYERFKTERGTFATLTKAPIWFDHPYSKPIGYMKKS